MNSSMESLSEIFSHLSSRSNSRQSIQTNSSSEQSLSSEKFFITKEVRFKEVEDKDKQIEKWLSQCGKQLDQQLNQLLSIADNHWSLTLDSETIQEIKTFFMDHVEMCAKQATTTSINWRDGVTSDGDNNKNLEKYFCPVVDQIDRLRTMLTPLKDSNKINNNKPAFINNNNYQQHQSASANIESVDGDEDNNCVRNDNHNHMSMTHQLEISRTTTNTTTTTPSDEDFFLDFNLHHPSRNTFTQLRQQYNQGWQFWFWRSDQRYFKWEFGLQKLGKPLNSVDQLHTLIQQLISVQEVGKFITI